MSQRAGLKRRVTCLLMTFLMIVGTFAGMIPCTGMELYAAETPYGSYIPTDDDTEITLCDKVISFNSQNWYIISDDSTNAEGTEGTVTLFAKDPITDFTSFGKSSVYEGSYVERYLRMLSTREGASFYGVDDVIVTTELEDVRVTDAKLYLLSIYEAEKKVSKKILPCSSELAGENGIWWLRIAGANSSKVSYVKCSTGKIDWNGISISTKAGIRPALRLDLSKVKFDAQSRTFTEKLDQTITAPVAKTAMVYTGEEQELLEQGVEVTEGNPLTEAVLYSMDEGETWSTDIPSATDAGDYKIYYKVEGNADYKEYVCSEEEAISVTIDKADPELPTGLTVKYHQSLKDAELPKYWTWQNPLLVLGTIGEKTYKADFIPEGDDAKNYNSKSDVDLTISVEKADGRILFGKDSIIMDYGDEYPGNSFTLYGDGKVSYASDNENVATVGSTSSDVTVKGAGTAIISATVEDTDTYTYNTKTVSFKLTVNKGETTVSEAPEAAEIICGKPLADSALSGGEGLFKEDAVEGSFVWADPSIVPELSDSETTEYEAVFTPTSQNYAESSCKVTVKVIPVDMTELNEAIKEAEEYYNSIKDNPDYDKPASELNDIINEAKKLAEDDAAKYPEVVGKIEALKNARTVAEAAVKDIDDAKEAEKKKSEEADKKSDIAYKNEWVDGQWYGADGNSDYKAKGAWKENDKGWWFEDTDGWYAKNQWQKIDGKWYYFTEDGYMDYSEYRDGYWLGSDGAWNEAYKGGHWAVNSTGWWYTDASGWYPANQYLWIDGVKYWFGSNGYWE